MTDYKSTRDRWTCGVVHGVVHTVHMGLTVTERASPDEKYEGLEKTGSSTSTNVE